MENPMGDGKKQALRVSFDGRLKLEFHGSNITSDAGLLAYRELDEVLELTARSGGLLDDWRSQVSRKSANAALILTLPSLHRALSLPYRGTSSTTSPRG
jgi:hypothetical protein